MARTANEILLRRDGLLEAMEARCQGYEDALEEIAERQMKDAHGLDMLPTMRNAQDRAKRALGYPPDEAA